MRSPTTSPLPANLKALTSLRLLLALGVALFHYQLQWTINDTAATGIISLGYVGVDIFFILSGFVLTHAYQHEVAQGRYSHGRFLIARLARIYPMHLAALALVLAMVAGARLLGAQFGEDRYTWAGLLWTLSLTHVWWPTAAPLSEWNGPAWSLSAEWFAYLTFPAFAWIGLRLRRRPIALLGLAVLVFAVLDLVYRSAFGLILPHAQDNLGILRIIPEFLYGVALYRAAERWPLGRAAAWAAVAGSTLLLLSSMHLRGDPRLAVLLAGPVVLSLALLARAGADGPIAHRWMLVGGEISYAFYLLHMPVLVLWKNLAALVTDAPSSYPLAPWEVAVLIPLTLGAALAAHYTIERPGRRLIRRWMKLLPTRGRGSAAIALG